MPRLRQLPEGGIRRTITFRSDLDEKLAIAAAQRRIPISSIVEELVERGLRPNPTPESIAAEFPPDWDGSDLRERLYYLRMRQTDLAEILKIPVNTLNDWVRGSHPFTKRFLPLIQRALKAHKPGPILGFRVGSRSPDI